MPSSDRYYCNASQFNQANSVALGRILADVLNSYRYSSSLKHSIGFSGLLKLFFFLGSSVCAFCHYLVLKSQVEAQEAAIEDFSYLCGLAEALCSSLEEQMKNSFIDLPVWASPRELMASLCDE